MNFGIPSRDGIFLVHEFLSVENVLSIRLRVAICAALEARSENLKPL